MIEILYAVHFVEEFPKFKSNQCQILRTNDI